MITKLAAYGKEKENGDVSFFEKSTYLISNAATVLSFGFITSYFMMFCTDAIGISSAVCSTILLFSRLYDGATDLFCGYIADTTVSKWGRYRPWVFIAAVPVALCTVLLFGARPEWSMPAKAIWITVIYLVFLTAFTCFNVPLDAMVSVMTPSQKTRANIISVKSAAEVFGAMLMAQFATKFLENNGTSKPDSYFHLAIIFALVSIPLYWAAPLFCKERIVPQYMPEKRKISFKTAFTSDFKSLPFAIALAGHFLNGLISYGRVSVFTYYFKYVAGDLGLFATFIMIMRIAQIAGCYCAQYIMRLFSSVGKAISAFYIAFGILLIANFYIVPNGGNIFVFWIFTAVSSFIFGISYSLVFTIIPDIVEYNEKRSGTRSDGGISAFLALGNKVGMAVGTAGIGILLKYVGYVPNAVQTVQASAGINSLMFLFPGAFSIIIGVLFFFYKLDAGTSETQNAQN